MSKDWGLFTEDVPEDQYQSLSYLLPSSLKEVWDQGDGLGVCNSPGSPSPRFQNGFGEFGSPPRPNSRPFPFAESAPALSFMEEKEGAVPKPEPEIAHVRNISHDASVHYFQVQFHPNREDIFRWIQPNTFNPGDFVVTEADRGFDIGRVTEEVEKPTMKESKQCKDIIRMASQHEIAQLPLKHERESKAQKLCQEKAAELGLNMQITGAEFQFDGKKLSFYYIANSYIDFRDLVRMLYKTFGMRIWMVWHDGKAPIRDVLQRNDRN